MSIVKAILRAAVSFALLTLVAVLTNAQADPPKLTRTPPPQVSERRKDTDVEELRDEIRQLKLSLEQVRKELSEIRQMLRERQAAARPAAPEKISIATRPARGSDAARIVVVEFSDYQCPFCAMFFRQTLPQLDQDYIKTGKIKYVFNNVPLDQIHPAAFKAAEAAECAGDQSKFWEMHDKIFSNPRTIAVADLTTHARAIGLDVPRFSQCLESGKSTNAVRAGLVQAATVGVDGTPTFVIALADARNPSDPNVKILSVISGAQPYAVFKSALDKALATP